MGFQAAVSPHLQGATGRNWGPPSRKESVCLSEQEQGGAVQKLHGGRRVSRFSHSFFSSPPVLLHSLLAHKSLMVELKKDASHVTGSIFTPFPLLLPPISPSYQPTPTFLTISVALETSHILTHGSIPPSIPTLHPPPPHRLPPISRLITFPICHTRSHWYM